MPYPICRRCGEPIQMPIREQFLGLPWSHGSGPYFESLRLRLSWPAYRDAAARLRVQAAAYPETWRRALRAAQAATTPGRRPWWRRAWEQLLP